MSGYKKWGIGSSELIETEGVLLELLVRLRGIINDEIMEQVRPNINGMEISIEET